MNRAEFQQLAEDRILDAAVLVDPAHPRWSAAYYLAGYAVECGLKSCVLAHVERTKGGVISEDRKFSEKCWTHNLEELVKCADLDSVFGHARQGNADLDGYWSVAKAWTEASRYQQKSRIEAEAIYEAITDNPNGVMAWIRTHW